MTATAKNRPTATAGDTNRDTSRWGWSVQPHPTEPRRWRGHLTEHGAHRDPNVVAHTRAGAIRKIRRALRRRLRDQRWADARDFQHGTFDDNLRPVAAPPRRIDWPGHPNDGGMFP